MSFDKAHAAVASMAGQVHTQLHTHRNSGGTDEELLDNWISTFVAQARQMPGPAVLIHTAVSLYTIALATDEIARLRDAVAMRDEALRVAWAENDAHASE
jgi:hypothetical protein